MQFRTVRLRQNGADRHYRPTGPRGEFFAFACEVSHDPTIECVGVQLSPDVERCFSREYWPDMQFGVQCGGEVARRQGARLCCTNLLITQTEEHIVDTSYAVVMRRLEEFVQLRVVSWSEPITLRAELLSSDVVALARGIHADTAFDRLPVLADALQDADCDDALILEHLRTCPYHAPSCWVVEMILAQAAARDTGAASS